MMRFCFIAIVCTICFGIHAQTKVVPKKTATTKTISTASKGTLPKEQLVEITTDYGVMVAKLYNQTPLHRDNFIKLIKLGFYDSLLFHRVIKTL